MGDSDNIAARRYEILEAIGKGGTGSVFRAWDNQLGRYVAIKRINEDADIEASIRQEAAILAALHHPNIVTIFDFDSDEHGPFVVMELVNGRTLEVIAREHPLTLTGFFELANQVCHGLSAAHSKGLIHRDLKPGNLMLHFHEDRSFTLKVLDFGLAKHNQDVETDVDTGSVVGSAYTIAPEQLAHEPLDHRTDIYSLGIVFFYSLTGRYPYEAATIDEVVDAHLNKHPASLHLVRDDVPEALSLVVSKMLARDPGNRPQSVEEVRVALNAVARAPASKRPNPLPAGTVRSAKKSPMLFVIPIAVAVGAAALWLVLHSSHPIPAAAGGGAASATPSGPAKVDPLDYMGISNYKGEAVIAEGVITSLAEDDAYATRDLKFSETNMNALIIAFPRYKFPADKVNAYVGKRVRVTGTISEVEGLYRIVVSNGSEIEVLDSSQNP